MTAEMAHCRGAVQYCRYSRTDRQKARGHATAYVSPRSKWPAQASQARLPLCSGGEILGTVSNTTFRPPADPV